MKKRSIAFSCVLILGAVTGENAQTAAPHVTGQTGNTASLASRAQAALSVVRGTLRIAGLQRPVDVLRDRWGVAHIYARHQHHLFFTQGFVPPEDRLFQMALG